MHAPDQLHEMFLMHKAFNERVGAPVANMNEAEKAKCLARLSQAATRRIAELAWNPLSRHQEADAQNTQAGIVALFELAINCAQVLGMDANDVFEAYVRGKAASFRQEQTSGFVNDERLQRQVETRN